MGENMYFRLNPECYLIRGEKLGAIYDLIDMKMYSLNQQETEIITSCEKNKPAIGDETFLYTLKQLCLGNFYNSIVYINKLRITSTLEPTDPLANIPPQIHRAFLEINNSCNRDCWFCGYYGIKRSLGCMGCNKWKGDGTELSIKRWKELIDELKYLDCKNLFITGGDLTLVWDKTIDILNYAKEMFGNIYVILHQKSMLPDKINDLGDKIKVIIQTEDLRNLYFKDSICLLVVKPTDWENAIKIKNKNTMNDFVVNNDNRIPVDHIIVSRKKISPVNTYDFLNNVEYHPCLGNTLAICNNGNVTPCTMMRNHIFGNVRAKTLGTVLESGWEEIIKFWKLNLDKIEKCTSCEFRYSCTDCRALEERLTGKLDGKILCSYNPKEGAWS
ncbi:MAG: radical SAM protein [Methanotrichaceae archaeon]